MNVINYIRKNKDLTFKEKKLTEIDKMIFGVLSYITYDGLVATNSFSKRPLREVANKYFETHTKKIIKKNIIGIRAAIEIFKELKDTKRYGDLLLYNDVYITNENSQFSAVCIEISPFLTYVSFEGTDELLSGWEEDCKMAYEFPVEAQKYAIKYLNKHFTLAPTSLIIGGHSKGGNLALVASMFCNRIVRRKIKEVYSYDGPGLRLKQIESKKYNKIKPKYKHIIPNNSIIGMILRNSGDSVIVKTNTVPGLSHNTLTWQIENDDFKKGVLSKNSINLNNKMIKWLNKYSDLERKKMVDEVFKIFREKNITSLKDIMNNYKLVFDILKSTNTIDQDVKDMAKDFISILMKNEKEKGESHV